MKIQETWIEETSGKRMGVDARGRIYDLDVFEELKEEYPEDLAASQAHTGDVLNE